MEYKKINDPKLPHLYTFENWEIQTLKAAYTESSILSEIKGNATDSEHDRFIILFPENKAKLPIKTSRPGLLTQMLEDFADRTEEAVFAIANLDIPAHENRYAIERRRLGEWATALALEIRKAAEETAKVEENLSDEEIMERHIQAIQNLPETQDPRAGDA